MTRKRNNGKGKQNPMTPKQASQIILQEKSFSERRTKPQKNNNYQKGAKRTKNNNNVVVSGKTSVGSSAVVQNKKEILKLTRAMTMQEGHYVLPREVSGIVSANTYQWTQELNLQATDPKNVAFILRPEVSRLLSVGSPGVAQTTDASSQSTYSPSYETEITSQPLSLWFDVKVGGHAYQPTPDPSLPLYMVGKDAMIPGGWVLPVNVGGASPATWSVLITNGTGATYSYSINLKGYTGQLGSLTTTGALTLNTTGSVSTMAGIAVNFAALPGYAAWWTAISAVGVDHIGLDIVQTSTQEYAADAISFTSTISSFLIDTGFHWTTYSLYDLMPVQSNFRSVFESSDSYSITGFNVLLSNVTPVLDKGGSIFAAQLPGRSEDRMPRTFQQLLNLVKSQKMRTLRDNQLALGAHYNWVPEKPNDVWFYPPSDQSDRPFGVCCITVPGAQGFSMQIVGQLTVELMTTDPVLVKERSPANAELAKAVVSAWSEVDCWTHNPSHLDHLAKAARQIVESPQVHQVLYNAAMAGIKYGPMVISALLA